MLDNTPAAGHARRHEIASRTPRGMPRPHGPGARRATAAALAVGLAGCASAAEHALPPADTPLDAWREAPPGAAGPPGADALAGLPDAGAGRASGDLPGSAPRAADGLDTWVARAALESPTLRALHARWRAARLRVAPARRLPDPRLSYAWYARSVETRVGPQRHRLSVRQDLPWPGRLEARGEAAAEAARAAGRALDAGLLEVRREVADAWWALWRVRAEHAVDTRQEALLTALVDATRAGVEAGRASAADVAEVELRLVRQRDHRKSHGTAARAALARLRAVAGLPPDSGGGALGSAGALGATPPAEGAARDPGTAARGGGASHGQGPRGDDAARGPDGPGVAWDGPAGVPGSDPEALLAALRAHPDLSRLAALARAEDARARAREAEGLPDLGLGLDWIETGDAVMDQPDGGKDAVIVGVSMRVPLQRGAYGAEADAARADANAQRAEREAAFLAARARLAELLAAVEDADRRLRLLHDDLLPRARAAWEARLARYAAAGATGGDLNGAIRAAELALDLAREAVRLRAAHGVAWARLEALVGRPVPRRGGGAPEGGAR